MSAEHIVIAAIVIIGGGFMTYFIASSVGIVCRLRDHRWMYGTSLDETTHGRDCMRCAKKQRWWSKWMLSSTGERAAWRSQIGTRARSRRKFVRSFLRTYGA